MASGTRHAKMPGLAQAEDKSLKTSSTSAPAGQSSGAAPSSARGTKRSATSPTSGPAPVSPVVENRDGSQMHDFTQPGDHSSRSSSRPSNFDLDEVQSIHSSDAENVTDDPQLFDTDSLPLAETDQILNSIIEENYGIKRINEHLTPPVSDLLASTMDQWALKVPEKNDIKMAFDQCKVPINIKSLGPIRINDIIYQRLPFKAKESDRQAQNLASYYVRAMGPLTYIWDCFIKAQAWAIKNKRDTPALSMSGENISICELTACLSAAIKLLCFHNALNLQRRKTSLRQHLDPKYFSLASPNNPISQLLFGDNLEQ